jgi:hypothetical protein
MSLLENRTTFSSIELIAVRLSAPLGRGSVNAELHCGAVPGSNFLLNQIEDVPLAGTPHILEFATSMSINAGGTSFSSTPPVVYKSVSVN